MDNRNDPATKGDIEDLRTEIAGLRTATKGDIEDLRTEIAGLRTATKGDIGDLRTEMNGLLNGLRTDMSEKIEMLRAEVSHGYHDLVERIEDGQTKLLTGIYGFIQSNNERLRGHDDFEAGTKKRLSIIEERLTDLERKVNFPTQPPQ